MECTDLELAWVEDFIHAFKQKGDKDCYRKTVHWEVRDHVLEVLCEWENIHGDQYRFSKLINLNLALQSYVSAEETAKMEWENMKKSVTGYE